MQIFLCYEEKETVHVTGQSCHRVNGDAITLNIFKDWYISLTFQTLRVYSVNVTKSAVSCRFGHVYWRNP